MEMEISVERVAMRARAALEVVEMVMAASVEGRARRG